MSAQSSANTTSSAATFRPDGKYGIGLELAGGMTAGIATTPQSERKPVTSPRLNLLFLAFGFAGLLVAAFYPL